MRTREVAEICGVSVQTVVTNARKIGKEIQNGVATEWSEEDLKKLQLVLMKNAQNAGGQRTEGSVVKEHLQGTLKASLTFQMVIESGDEALFNDYMKEATDRFKTHQALKLEQQKNQQLLIENNQLTHALEYDKVKDWRSWSTVKAELKPKFEIFRHRISFYDVVNDVGLIKGEDYEEKVMGRDTRPTKLVSSKGEGKIFDWYDTHTF